MSLGQCRLLDLSTVVDSRGRLTYIESGRHIDFDIRRVYYMYDLEDGATRGGHAHLRLQQLMIAIFGELDVTLDDGHEKRTFRLATPSCGLMVGQMVWRTVKSLSAHSVCCVLASEPYDEADYVRDYSAFLDAARRLA